MYNVTLVCTHHTELGKCNPDELYNIIESIRPDVIFEELAQDLFGIVYSQSENPKEPPEIKSVRKYINDHTTTHIPVDINDDTLSDREIDYMYDTLEKNDAYLKLEEVQRKLAIEQGYKFLNSKKSEELIEENKHFVKRLIESQTNNDELSRIYELFYEKDNKRENQIIKNIYNYSEKNPYNQALLLLGSAHRKAISEKIKKYESESHVKLNWTFYGH